MILTEENKLRIPCEEASEEEASSIIQKLEEELLLSEKNGKPGIGLAAPQIGIYKKVAVIRLPTSSGIIKIDLVNLKNIKGYFPNFFQGEGCLSFPDRYEKTWRYSEIYVIGNQVKPYNFIATGLLSVAIQHEWDHVLGILMIDRAQVSQDLIRGISKYNFITDDK